MKHAFLYLRRKAKYFCKGFDKEACEVGFCYLVIFLLLSAADVMEPLKAVLGAVGCWAGVGTANGYWRARDEY